MALVPFSYSSPFADSLKLEERIFDIAGHVLRIKQGYLPDGKGGTSLGFGASVYAGAFVLAHYLSMHRELVENQIIVELGCGTGLTSIAAALLGCKGVIATDGGEESLQLTAENAQQNILDESTTSRLKTSHLFWGNQAHLQEVRQLAQSLRRATTTEESKGEIAATESAREDTTQEEMACPDVILAADVAALPYQEAYQALVDTLSDLSNERTRILLVYQRRHATEQKFFRKLGRVFDVQLLDQADTIHPDFQQFPISMFLVTKRLGEAALS